MFVYVVVQTRAWSENVDNRMFETGGHFNIYPS
jgi:hypothetical protein